VHHAHDPGAPRASVPALAGVTATACLRYPGSGYDGHGIGPRLADAPTGRVERPGPGGYPHPDG